MDAAARAAFVQSQAACMNAELAAMQAANLERVSNGHSIAYDEAAFLALPDKYQLGWNTVIEYLRS